MNTGRLAGKVAIITGAGTGIGEAISLKFAQERARLVLNGLPDDPVNDVVQRINALGCEAVTYLGDVSEQVHAQECVNTAVQTYGELHILINNAGIFPEVNEIQEFS